MEGNHQKMREALEGLARAVRAFMATKGANFYPDVAIALEAANAALSLPPRNCDVMSLESAKKVWLAKEIMPRIDGDLPLGNEIPFDDWFVSQYYQGEGDGSK